MRYLELGIGGTIDWYPPEGVPDAMPVPTVEIRGLLTAVAATRDASSTAVAGAVAGDRALTVTASTGFVAGRRYWIGPVAPIGYEDSIVEITDGTHLTVEEPLKIAATLIRGMRLSYAVPNALCPAERGTDATDGEPLAVIWRYSVGGVTCRGRDSAAICLDPFRLSATEDDVKARDPGMPGQSGSRGSWRRFCAVAQDDIALMLRALRIEPHNAQPDGLTVPYVYRILYHRYRGVPDRAEEFESLASRAMRDYVKAYHSESRL